MSDIDAIETREAPLMRPLMRLIAGLTVILCAFVAVTPTRGAAAAPTATVPHTLSCLHRHHVLADDQGLARASGFHGGEWIHFTFTGTPTGAIDGGAIIIERDRAIAARAAKGAYSYLYSYSLKHLNGATPAYLKLLLAATLRVDGNAVELWNDAPVSKPALRVMSACLST